MNSKIAGDSVSEQFEQVKRITESLILDDRQLLAVCDSFDRELSEALRPSASSSPSSQTTTLLNGGINGASSEQSSEQQPQQPQQNSPLCVFPTYISQIPSGTESGKYLALDLGGTNFRVLLIELSGDRHSHVSTEIYSISRELMRGHGEQLFDYIATCLYEFVRANGMLRQTLMLGFTFSFPCRQQGRARAVLSKWTKGFSCPDAIGADIGEMLRRSIEKHDGLQVHIAAIVNDTTGTLISCAYQEPDCRMGVIVGTGVNICYMESKFETADHNRSYTQMIINTELGAFGSENGSIDHVRTKWDFDVDQRSINRGQQLYEKMISGMYLGEIVRTIVVDLVRRRVFDSSSSSSSSSVFASFHRPDAFQTSMISQIELDDPNSGVFENTANVLRSMMMAANSGGNGDDKAHDNHNSIPDVSIDDCKALHLICSRVSRRSAHLTSATIAALLRRMARAYTVVGVDGSVFRCHPHYRTLMNEKIAQLLQISSLSTTAKNFSETELPLLIPKFKLMLSEDGSGRGAALAAATASGSISENCNSDEDENRLNSPISSSDTVIIKCCRCKSTNLQKINLIGGCRVCAVAV